MASSLNSSQSTIEENASGSFLLSVLKVRLLILILLYKTCSLKDTLNVDTKANTSVESTDCK